MKRMIDDLLDFTITRLGSGMPLRPAPFDLGVLCSELIAECHAAHTAREIEFKMEGNLKGDWDSDRIRQAISNLLGNAIQHGSAASPITLSLTGEPLAVIVKVHNGGETIPPCELYSIFEPLVRGASTQGRKVNVSGSIGLGLFIAREVAIPRRTYRG